MKRLWNIIKSVLYFLYNFSGIRHLWENIIFPIDKDTKKWKPSTFIIWIIGLYAALFGIASQRYENRVDLIEIRISSVFTQLSTPLYKRAFTRIAETQKLSCPLKPDIKNPTTVFQSLFNDTIYFEGVDLLKETVENWKDSLSGADLKGANLIDANLRGADLSSAYLIGSDLNHADLSRANLSRAILSGAILNGAILSGAILFNANLNFASLNSAHLNSVDLNSASFNSADLIGADLNSAILFNANLKGANLKGADLRGADLIGADLSRADLSRANLNGARLDSVNFNNTLGLRKDKFSNSYYIQNPPINLPEGIVPPPKGNYIN